MRILATGGPKVPSIETPFSKLAKAVLAMGEDEGDEMGAGADAAPDGNGEMGEYDEAPPEEGMMPGMEGGGGGEQEMMALMQMLEQHPALKQLIMQLMMQGGMGGGEEGMPPGMGGEEEGAEPGPEELLEQTMGGAGSGEAPADMGGMAPSPSPMKMGSARTSGGLSASEALQIARDLY